MTPLLLEDFCLLQDGVQLFQSVSLRLEGGDIVGVRGENGVGKSTLLRALAGVRRPGASTRGSARVLGSPVDLPVASRARAGVMLVRQAPTTYANLTAREQLMVSAMFGAPLGEALLGRFSSRQRVDARAAASLAGDALERFAIADLAETAVRNLSVGQLRLLALASAAARLALGRLRLLLLDEPASGLDAAGKERLTELLRDASAAGCGLLMAEHVDPDAPSLAYRTVQLTVTGTIP